MAQTAHALVPSRVVTPRQLRLGIAPLATLLIGACGEPDPLSSGICANTGIPAGTSETGFGDEPPDLNDTFVSESSPPSLPPQANSTFTAKLPPSKPAAVVGLDQAVVAAFSSGQDSVYFPVPDPDNPTQTEADATWERIETLSPLPCVSNTVLLDEAVLGGVHGIEVFAYQISGPQDVGFDGVLLASSEGYFAGQIEQLGSSANDQPGVVFRMHPNGDGTGESCRWRKSTFPGAQPIVNPSVRAPCFEMA